MTGLPDHYYREELNKCVWEVPINFRDLTPLGSGAYGQVCSAIDDRLNYEVAIKKLSRPFQSILHAKRAYRELRLLKHMKHENVISLLDTFTPQQSLSSFEDVYLVSPLMGSDLNKIMMVQTLRDEHVRFLIYQLLRGLKYIHSAGVLHRDLKPSNVAVNQDCELKIIDFGLARAANDLMSGYVATRHYRAPEIMLNWMQYNELVDVWSVGCIMAELLTGSILFPGDNYIDQLTRIMQLVGKPSEAFLEQINSDNARNYIASMPNFQRTQWFPNATNDARDVLTKMLAFDPSERWSCAQCLEHQYFADYHDPCDEPSAPVFEEGVLLDENITIEELKRLMLDEIQSFVFTPPPTPKSMLFC